MVTQIQRLCLLILIGLCSLPSTTWAVTKLTAHVDRNPVMERESFVLEIVADDSVSSAKLDLSPLNSTGFTVGRTASSSQTQIINGSISKSTTWSIVLVAMNAGEYRIPSFELDGVKSQPLTVEVIKTTQNAGQANQPIFLRNTLEQDTLYLQQTVKLVTRLYFSPQVELQSGTLSDPILDEAIVQQQGKDKETSEILSGVRYRVIERVYTVTPQASGEFVLKSPAFNGEVASGNRRRSMFSTFTQTKPVSAFGDDMTIEVKPIPEDYQGTWLPSELVQLNEEWQPEKTEFEVGEAITRTFTLTALNVNKEQLPDIEGQYPSGFKVYPDQSESHSVLRKNALVSQRVSSEAIVANQPGEFELPEVTISWFNTRTGRQENARVPAKTVTILPAKNAATLAASPLAPGQSQVAGDLQCPTICPAEGSGQRLDPGTQSSSIAPPWLLSSGWLLWLGTLLVWFIRHRRPVIMESSPGSRPFDLHELKAACLRDDAKGARAALLAWGRHKYEDVTTLSQLEKRVPPALQREIRRLNLAQYSQNPTHWHGENLWQTIKQVDKRPARARQETTELAPLNG